jgi:hypothetical protein
MSTVRLNNTCTPRDRPRQSQQINTARSDCATAVDNRCRSLSLKASGDFFSNQVQPRMETTHLSFPSCTPNPRGLQGILGLNLLHCEHSLFPLVSLFSSEAGQLRIANTLQLTGTPLQQSLLSSSTSEGPPRCRGAPTCPPRSGALEAPPATNHSCPPRCPTTRSHVSCWGPTRAE